MKHVLNYLFSGSHFVGCFLGVRGCKLSAADLFNWSPTQQSRPGGVEIFLAQDLQETEVNQEKRSAAVCSLVARSSSWFSFLCDFSFNFSFCFHEFLQQCYSYHCILICYCLSSLFWIALYSEGSSFWAGQCSYLHEYNSRLQECLLPYFFLDLLYELNQVWRKLW